MSLNTQLLNYNRLLISFPNKDMIDEKCIYSNCNILIGTRPIPGRSFCFNVATKW
jgi:hypothetical protein